MEITSAHPSMKNNASTFRAKDASKMHYVTRRPIG
jgi:hypothetical protein